MKDYIIITKNDNTKEKMEIVFTCESNELNKKYIVYKSTKTRQFYAASYTGLVDNCQLDTNLSKEEKDFLENAFAKVRRVNNA